MRKGEYRKNQAHLLSEVKIKQFVSGNFSTTISHDGLLQCEPVRALEVLNVKRCHDTISKGVLSPYFFDQARGRKKDISDHSMPHDSL